MNDQISTPHTQKTKFPIGSILLLLSIALSALLLLASAITNLQGIFSTGLNPFDALENLFGLPYLLTNFTNNIFQLVRICLIALLAILTLRAPKKNLVALLLVALMALVFLQNFSSVGTQIFNAFYPREAAPGYYYTYTSSYPSFVQILISFCSALVSCTINVLLLLPLLLLTQKTEKLKKLILIALCVIVAGYLLYVFSTSAINVFSLVRNILARKLFAYSFSNFSSVFLSCWSSIFFTAGIFFLGLHLANPYKKGSM